MNRIRMGRIDDVNNIIIVVYGPAQSRGKTQCYYPIRTATRNRAVDGFSIYRLAFDFRTVVSPVFHFVVLYSPYRWRRTRRILYAGKIKRERDLRIIIIIIIKKSVPCNCRTRPNPRGAPAPTRTHLTSIFKKKNRPIQ